MTPGLESQGTWRYRSRCAASAAVDRGEAVLVGVRQVRDVGLELLSHALERLARAQVLGQAVQLRLERLVGLLHLLLASLIQLVLRVRDLPEVVLDRAEV